MEITDVKSSIWSTSLATAGELVQGVEHIKQNINIVLTTRQGSDALRPDFGCGIFQKLDKPLPQVRAALVNDVKTALELWIPEITVVKISFVMAVGQLEVTIQWAFKNTIDTKQVNTTYGVMVPYRLAA